MKQDKPNSKRRAAASAGKIRSPARPQPRTIKPRARRSADNATAVTRPAPERGGTLWTGIASDDAD